MYIIPMYLRLTTFTKTLPQMSFHLYFLLFLFCSGAPPMTLLTAGALTDPRLPATASNMCTTDARLGGVGRVPPPPQNKNPGYAGVLCRFICTLFYVEQKTPRLINDFHSVDGFIPDHCRTINVHLEANSRNGMLVT